MKLTILTDLRNSDITSDSFIKKVQRAHEAMSHSSETNSIRTLSASFGQKWPYKRTMSAPASTLIRNDQKYNGKNFKKSIVKEISEHKILVLSTKK